MRLDVFGDAEGAAVGLPAVVEAQLVAAGDGVLRQLEAAIGAALRVEAEVRLCNTVPLASITLRRTGALAAAWD